MARKATRLSQASPIPARRTCDCGSGLADTETIPSSGGVRACSRCYNQKHEAYAFTGGVAEHSDDPRAGSDWHYSRNPPQRYTITEGGRRVRLAGGNTFPSKGEAQDAAKFLRHTEGGDYKVRALKPGESVGRVAVANGKSARVGKVGCSARVRRSVSNTNSLDDVEYVTTRNIHDSYRAAASEAKALSLTKGAAYGGEPVLVRGGKCGPRGIRVAMYENGKNIHRGESIETVRRVFLK